MTRHEKQHVKKLYPFEAKIMLVHSVGDSYAYCWDWDRTDHHLNDLIAGPAEIKISKLVFSIRDIYDASLK